MSKSLGNCIYLSDSADELKQKVMNMFTDPNHLRVADPGRVEGNPVFTYLDAFSSDADFADFLPEYENLAALKAHYERGGLGDVKVKRFLLAVLDRLLTPIRERREAYAADPGEVMAILRRGTEKARRVTDATLERVRAAMQIEYFA